MNDSARKRLPAATLAAIVVLVLIALGLAVPLFCTATAGALPFTQACASASNEDSVAVTTDGVLWTWGANRYGSLGQGDVLPRTYPVRVGLDSDWKTAVTGGWYMMGLKQDGTLFAWGDNELGQLGMGDDTSRFAPTPVPSGGHKWLAVACGFEHTIAIRDDHTLWAWGSNHSHELGLGDTTARTSPVQVGIDTTWASVACGSYDSLAIKMDGSLWAWGSNDSGELGLGDIADRAVPTKVGTANNWAAVSGTKHDLTPFTVALKTDGSLYAWGFNGDGELGLGDTVDRHSPVHVSPGTHWSAMSAGSYCALGVQTDGTLWGWGLNNGAQLGTTPSNPQTTPHQIGSDTNWASVSAGYIHSMGTKLDGSIWAWGSNWYGQLAIGYPNLRCSPYQVGAVGGWRQVSAGMDHAAAVRTDNTLWAWGAGGLGQLGTPSQADATSPVQVSGTDWAKVACGNNYTLAIKTDGTLWSWGANSFGQLGLGDTDDHFEPTQVGTRTDWASVACADGFWAGHVLAVTTGGELYAWGLNNFGQLGIGTTHQHTSPVRVGLASDWAAVACGNNHSAALKTDGSLYTWGSNGGGQLGIGSTVEQDSPVNVMPGTKWLSVACGSGLNDDIIPGSDGSTVAVRDSNTLWTWGGNSLAQLGSGDYTNSDIPVQRGSWTIWQDVSACSYFGTSLARMIDGRLYSTGDGLWGTPGLGFYGPVQSFTQIAPGSHWTSMDGGGRNAFAIADDGTLWAWGFNLSGELGLGDPLIYPSPVQLVFSAAADVTPPDMGVPARSASPRGGVWYKKPVTVKFSATDPGSGVARVQYSLNGGIGWHAGSLVTSASVKVTRNGETDVRYQAVDRRGNVTSIKDYTVRIDQLRPKPYATTVSVARGGTANLKYKVADVSPQTVKIVIKNAHGATVRTFTIHDVTPAVWQIKSFHCTLAKGAYHWYVTSTDSVGLKQVKAAVGKLKVT